MAHLFDTANKFLIKAQQRAQNEPHESVTASFQVGQNLQTLDQIFAECLIREVGFQKPII